MTREELQIQVDQGRRVADFLNDALIQGVLKSLKISYFERWLTSTTPAEREKLHANASAFDDLQIALEALVQSGERANDALTGGELETI